MQKRQKDDNQEQKKKHLLKIFLAWQDAQLNSTTWPCLTSAPSHGAVKRGS